jgi:predicted P-loop ATPase
MSDDDMNWPDGEPPPPKSEDDYGANVVVLPKGKRSQPGWKNEWHYSEQGSPLPTLHNAMVVLRNHPQMCSIVRYDEMARTTILIAQIPDTPHDPSIPRPIKDADVLAIQEAMQQTGLRRIGKPIAQDAIQLRSEQDRYHPVLDYLNSLQWDGEKRINGWLGRYLGVEGNPYSDTIGELFLIALVARIMQPGCKADYMLILEGPQGALKSSACRVLAGEWFSDNLPDLSRGDAVRLSMHLRGKWLIEIAEMSSFSSAEAHTLKEFLTQTEERYIPKYGRFEVSEPRQCLFVGSTNEGTYLRDATGARRFWPVEVGEIKLSELIADRDQLIAEALTMFRAGAPWWPSREFEQAHIAPQQAARYEEDVWQAEVEDWLSRENIRRCTVNQILRGALSSAVSQISVREQRRVIAILKQIGWKRHRVGAGRFYSKPEDEETDASV